MPEVDSWQQASTCSGQAAECLWHCEFFFPKSTLQQSDAAVISGHSNSECATITFQKTEVFQARQQQCTRLATPAPHLSGTKV